MYCPARDRHGCSRADLTASRPAAGRTSSALAAVELVDTLEQTQIELDHQNLVLNLQQQFSLIDEAGGGGGNPALNAPTPPPKLA